MAAITCEQNRKGVMTKRPNTLERAKTPLIIMKFKNTTLMSHLSPDQMSHPFTEVKIFSVSCTFHFTMSFPKGKSWMQIIWLRFLFQGWQKPKRTSLAYESYLFLSPIILKDIFKMFLESDFMCNVSRESEYLWSTCSSKTYHKIRVIGNVPQTISYYNSLALFLAVSLIVYNPHYH